MKGKMDKYREEWTDRLLDEHTEELTDRPMDRREGIISLMIFKESSLTPLEHNLSGKAAPPRKDVILVFNVFLFSGLSN